MYLVHKFTKSVCGTSGRDYKLLFHYLSAVFLQSWTTDTSWLEGNYGGVDRLLIAVSEDWKPDLVIENV